MDWLSNWNLRVVAVLCLCSRQAFTATKPLFTCCLLAFQHHLCFCIAGGSIHHEETADSFLLSFSQHDGDWKTFEYLVNCTAVISRLEATCLVFAIVEVMHLWVYQFASKDNRTVLGDVGIYSISICIIILVGEEATWLWQNNSNHNSFISLVGNSFPLYLIIAGWITNRKIVLSGTVKNFRLVRWSTFFWQG